MEAATQTPQDTADAKANLGHVEEVQGVVVEVAFPPDKLPEIYNACLLYTSPSPRDRS